MRRSVGLSPLRILGGGGPPPSDPEEDPIILAKPSKDPCVGRTYVNELLSQTKNRQARDKMWSLTVENQYEYAYEGRINLTTKSIEYGSIRTDGFYNTIDYQLYYTNKNGPSVIDVAFNHTHPFISGPSPNDLFIGSNEVNTIPDGFRQVFLEYFSTTITTPNHIYVVTIKDVNAWKAMGNGTKSQYEIRMDEQNATYNKLVEVYKNNVSGSHDEAQEYALLTMYGDVVNIYRSPRTGTSDFKPLTLDSSTNKAIFRNCN